MPDFKIETLGREFTVDEVAISRQDERPNDYYLADGTHLRVKVTAVAVLRVKGEYDPDGNPVYIVKHAISSLPIEVGEGTRKPKGVA